MDLGAGVGAAPGHGVGATALHTHQSRRNGGGGASDGVTLLSYASPGVRLYQKKGEKENQNSSSSSSSSVAKVFKTLRRRSKSASRLSRDSQVQSKLGNQQVCFEHSFQQETFVYSTLFSLRL